MKLPFKPFKPNVDDIIFRLFGFEEVMLLKIKSEKESSLLAKDVTVAFLGGNVKVEIVFDGRISEIPLAQELGERE